MATGLRNPCARCGENEALVDELCNKCVDMRESFGALPSWVDLWWLQHGERYGTEELRAYNRRLTEPALPWATSFDEVFPIHEPLARQVGAEILERSLHVAPLPAPFGPVSRYCSVHARDPRPFPSALIVMPSEKSLLAIADGLVMKDVGGIQFEVRVEHDRAWIHWHYSRIIGTGVVACVRTSTLPRRAHAAVA